VAELLQKLFARHFDDPVAALRRFEQNLTAVSLPFEVIARLRELEFPPFPGFGQGMPSLIYYFVPGTGWGTYGRTASNPTAPDFVYACDGVSLNMGCPVRLARALETLQHLDAADRTECLECLRAANKHFAAVEELLWLTVWRGALKARRGGVNPGNKKSVDWFLAVQGVPILLEAKYRPADWPRLTDEGTHRPMDGFLLGKAADQFSKEKTLLSRRIVGVTGIAEPTDLLASMCEAELSQNDHVHAILYRTLLGAVHVFTRHEAILKELMLLFSFSRPDDFPRSYPVLYHWQQRDERVKVRCRSLATPKKSGSILFGVVGSEPSKVPFQPPPDPYRMMIEKYLDDGEPEFRVVTKYILR
jgi:hypothetical protein